MHCVEVFGFFCAGWVCVGAVNVNCGWWIEVRRVWEDLGVGGGHLALRGLWGLLGDYVEALIVSGALVARLLYGETTNTVTFSASPETWVIIVDCPAG